MNWYAINTKPGKEATAASILAQGGFEVYAPRIKVNRLRMGHYKDMVEPLFSCYIFARFDPEQHLWMIGYTRGVRRVVGGDDGPWAIPDDMIGLIRSTERDGIIRAMTTDQFAPGDMVRIMDGPFTGLDAVFQGRMNGAERALILLKTLEFQAQVYMGIGSLVKAH